LIEPPEALEMMEDALLAGAAVVFGGDMVGRPSGRRWRARDRG
jgi:hypothetical protein